MDITSKAQTIKLKLSKFDNFIVGFVLGLIAPVLTLFIVYFVTFENYTIDEFFHFLKTMKVLTKLFSLCVVPNLAIFFLFVWPNFLKGAKGTLSATFLIAVVIIIIQVINGGLF